MNDEPLTAGFVAGNVFDKYRTKNPLYQALMQRFLASCGELLAAVPVGDRVLEVGCGPGDLAARLFPASGDTAWRYVGSDLSLGEVATARQASSSGTFLPSSIEALPFPDRTFDCVLACEVFEHLVDPQAALAEVARVSRERAYLLLSVPWEPVWRLMNVLRGRYLGELGNTPGHLQHFSRRAIRRLVRSRFEILAERRPLPWTVLLARRLASPG